MLSTSAIDVLFRLTGKLVRFPGTSSGGGLAQALSSLHWPVSAISLPQVVVPTSFLLLVVVINWSSATGELAGAGQVLPA
jgi:hypothetical protein